MASSTMSASESADSPTPQRVLPARSVKKPLRGFPPPKANFTGLVK